MKLICIKPYVTHWGSILTVGKEYEFKSYDGSKLVQIIADEKMYYKSLTDFLKFAEGKDIEDLRKDTDEFDRLEKESSKYVIRVELEMIYTKCDDGKTMSFYTQTNKQIMNKFNLTEKCLNEDGKISFGHTMHSIDEYFDYSHIRRLEKLNKLL